jgi:transcriptional regulator with XRE-family HTH domain
MGPDKDSEKEPDKREEQRRLYGEPIADLVARVTGGLGLTQSEVASVIGLSPAMLSQLRTGHRVKIGNPLAVARLQSLLRLVEEAPRLTGEQLTGRIAEVRDSRPSLTTTQHSRDLATDPAVAEVVRRLLRAVASGQELARAVALLEPVSPGLAELVRVYGTGSRADAAEHLSGLAGLLRD